MKTSISILSPLLCLSALANAYALPAADPEGNAPAKKPFTPQLRDVYVTAYVRLNESGTNPSNEAETVHRMHSNVFFAGTKVDGPLQVELMLGSDSTSFLVRAYDFGWWKTRDPFAQPKLQGKKMYRVKVGQTTMMNQQLAHRATGRGYVPNVWYHNSTYSTHNNIHFNTDNSFVLNFITHMNMTLPEAMAKIFRDDDIFQRHLLTPKQEARVDRLSCQTPLRASTVHFNKEWRIDYNISVYKQPVLIMDQQFDRAVFGLGRSYPVPPREPLVLSSSSESGSSSQDAARVTPTDSTPASASVMPPPSVANTRCFDWMKALGMCREPKSSEGSAFLNSPPPSGEIELPGGITAASAPKPDTPVLSSSTEGEGSSDNRPLPVWNGNDDPWNDASSSGTWEDASDQGGDWHPDITPFEIENPPPS